MRLSVLSLVFLIGLLLISAQDSSSSSGAGNVSSSTGNTPRQERNASLPDCLDPFYFNQSCNYYSTVMPSGERYADNDTLIDTRYNQSDCGLSALKITKTIGAYKKYAAVPVCIKMGGLNKMVFFPQVDDYTLMQVASRKGLQRGRFDDPNMWVQIEIATASVVIVSPPKPRQKTVESGKSYIVPYWVAIVIMKDGIPSRIDWDDGCYGCSDDECVADTCGIGLDQCPDSRIEQTGIDCDIKVYIGWFGTDTDGQYLISAGKRPSRFKQYSISDAVSGAALTAYDNLPDAPVFSDGQDSNGNGQLGP